MSRIFKLHVFLESWPLYILIFASIIVLVPFFILPFFINPNAEDFSLSFFSKYSGTFNYIFDFYLHKDARIFTNLLYALNPLRYDIIWAYKLIPYLIISLLIITVFNFFKKIFNFNIRPNSYIFILTIVFVSLYFLSMPSVVHAFYWMASSLNYSVSMILLVFFVLFIFETRMKLINNLPVSLYKLLSGFCITYFLVLSNEIYILPLLFLLFILIVFDTHKNRYLRIFYFAFFILLILASTIYIIPQILFFTDEKQQINPNIYLIYSSFSNAFKFTFLNLIKWSFLNPILIIFSVFFFLNADKFIGADSSIVDKINVNVKRLIIFALAAFIFLCLMLVPYYLFRNPFHEPQRIFNVQYLVFLLIWFYVLIKMVLRFKQRIIMFKKHSKLNILMVLALFISLGVSINLKHAYNDILTGAANRYNKEMIYRYKEIYKAKSENKAVVKLKLLNNKPPSIYFPPDIELQINSIWNKAYENYFDIKEILVEE